MNYIYDKETGTICQDVYDWFNERREAAWDFHSALMNLGLEKDVLITEDLPEDIDTMRPYQHTDEWTDYLIGKFPTLEKDREKMTDSDKGFFDWDT